MLMNDHLFQTSVQSNADTPEVNPLDYQKVNTVQVKKIL